LTLNGLLLQIVLGCCASAASGEAAQALDNIVRRVNPSAPGARDTALSGCEEISA